MRRSIATHCAQAMNLEGLGPRTKSGSTYFFCNRSHHIGCRILLHMMALVTNHQQKLMGCTHGTAANKGIQTFYAVNEPLLKQKVQSTVNRSRLGCGVSVFQMVKQVISLDCSVF